MLMCFRGEEPEEDIIWRYRDYAYDYCKEHGKPTIKPLAMLKKICDRLAEFVANEWEDSVRAKIIANWYSMSNFGKVDPLQMKISANSEHFIGQFRTMIQRFMDWRHGEGRTANEKEIKRQWKNNFLSFLIRMNDGELGVREHMIEFPYPAPKPTAHEGPQESPEAMLRKPKRPVIITPESPEYQEMKKANKEAEAALKAQQSMQEKQKESVENTKDEVE